MQPQNKEMRCYRTNAMGEQCLNAVHGDDVMHLWEKTPVRHAHQSTASMVDHPAHYGGAGNVYEHVKVMEAILAKSPMNAYVGGLIYNCTKYLWRLGEKGSREDITNDVGKAKWYLDELVRYLNGYPSGGK